MKRAGQLDLRLRTSPPSYVVLIPFKWYAILFRLMPHYRASMRSTRLHIFIPTKPVINPSFLHVVITVAPLNGLQFLHLATRMTQISLWRRTTKTYPADLRQSKM